MHKLIMRLLVGFLLAGCAVKKELIPIGGSKADGTVRMRYSKSIFENPIVDLEQAKHIAAKKCHTWGYDDAEAFGGQTSVCAEMGSHGCNLTNVTVEYQCIGGKN